MLSSIVLLAAATAASASTAASPAPYRVSVRALDRAPLYGTPKDVADSVADVAKVLRGMKEIALVDDPKEAEAVVWVMDRGSGGRPGGYIGIDRGSFDHGRVAATLDGWVQAQVKAGETSQDFLGEGSSWGACAKHLAKQVRSWLQANRDRLRASPTPPQP